MLYYTYITSLAATCIVKWSKISESTTVAISSHLDVYYQAIRENKDTEYF